MTDDHPYRQQKEITFVVPCYNSAEYMDHCIDSILHGRGDIEIIIVNDGSTKDDTAAKADEWAQRHPGVIKVIHQENKGHGGAVMAGLRAASGVYFKVVDSDDWLDPVALNLTLSKLRHFIHSGSPVDLVIANYVYEHTNTGTQKVIRYRRMMPQNRIFTWNEMGIPSPGQNILMHSAIFRTQVLRDSGVELPEHTFYVDNIFVYVPLPSVSTLYYLPVNLYRYFIGREDQSVNESVQISRLDQQMRVTDIMIEAHKLPEGAGNRHLAGYMEQYLGLIMAASSMFALLEGTENGLRMRREMWEHVDRVDPLLKGRLGLRQPLVLAANLPGPLGRATSLALYRLAQRIYKFS
ncbi:MAG TPA: glycosyltransferase family A protein [Propioniciclava sp.]|uniref:glycosyltransferase family 2 protein n=1 Tax=Propioniciclava sp. TaxID=2038686 RepID=UPI002C12FE95|nr:glycosyltransferase family A protein [Propioniciclava sp.]HRL49432.1 glycosyltransferase family A protein [Propioniciclava sp.]HRL79242.1 glycosyltransferase family A protein [Propioniciclava sp.]